MGNAGLHDFHEILAVAMGAVPCKGQGSVDMGLFAKARAILAWVSQAREWRAQPCHPRLAEGQPAFPQARSGAVPGGVSAVHDSRFESPAATVSPMSRGWWKTINGQAWRRSAKWSVSWKPPPK
jgi:hypothetical protein